MPQPKADLLPQTPKQQPRVPKKLVINSGENDKQGEKLNRPPKQSRTPSPNNFQRPELKGKPELQKYTQ
ncbi:hypothetical protein X975_13769, partial [Stegodyphus mimosarum]